MIVLFLNFWGIAILFSIAATPVYIPINSVWRYFFCIHSDTGHFLFFYNSHTNRCEMISYCVSHLYFLNNQWYWTSFHVLFGYLCPCGKKSIQIFCKFFKHFLLLSCMITLYILDIISYWICDFTNILSHVVGSVQFSSVMQLCSTLCKPMNWSMPGLPIHHQLLESTQTHVHWVSDATQPSHPLSSHSPPTLNLSQHQGLIK